MTKKMEMMRIEQSTLGLPPHEPQMKKEDDDKEKKVQQ